MVSTQDTHLIKLILLTMDSPQEGICMVSNLFICSKLQHSLLTYIQIHWLPGLEYLISTFMLQITCLNSMEEWILKLLKCLLVVQSTNISLWVI